MNTHIVMSFRKGITLITFTLLTAVLLTFGNTANAVIVPTVPLGTAANYAVVGASTVTNTGNSVLDGSLGLWPGTSITGFPPGIVLPPGTTDATNTAAHQAQSDLTTAYVDAASRAVDTTTASGDLSNLTLQPGVYAGPAKSPLSLTGPLILDGAGDLSSVFIFQTDSTLTTASSSTVTLINGAQECNIFWQVGSSATLGTNSVFVGNILAQASITVTTGVIVHGRALARDAAVTLDTNTFTAPTCAQPPPPTTTTVPTTTTTTTTTTVPPTTTTTVPPTTTTVPPTTTFVSAITTTTGLITEGDMITIGSDTTTTTLPGTPIDLTSVENPGVPRIVGPPQTGASPFQTRNFPWLPIFFASLLGGAGIISGVVRSKIFASGAHSPSRHKKKMINP